MEIGKERQKVLDSWLLVEDQVSNEYHLESQRSPYLKSVRQKMQTIHFKGSFNPGCSASLSWTDWNTNSLHIGSL